MNGSSALIRSQARHLLFLSDLCHTRYKDRVAVCILEPGRSIELDPVDSDLGLPVSRTMRSKFCYL